MSSSPYLLDANIFITAARRYYAFDIVPGFWNSLIQLSTTNQIRSIDRVYLELKRGNDELSVWVKENLRGTFESTEQADILASFGEIMRWAQLQKQFTDAAKGELADPKNADGWLVAYAKAKGCFLVTNEVFNPNVKSRIPIPNICQALGVSYVDTFQMLRALGVKYSY